MLAVPVMTASSAYGVAEALERRHGLNATPRQARVFCAVIGASILTGVAVNLTGINPIGALFWSSVLNGLVAPPLLYVLIRVTNNPRIMGERVNGALINVLGWIATGLMTLAAIGFLLTWKQTV